MVKEEHGFSEEEFLVAQNVIMAMGSLKNSWMLDSPYFHDFVYYFRNLSNSPTKGQRDKGRKKLKRKLEIEDRLKKRNQDKSVVDKTGLATKRQKEMNKVDY